jgi:thiamine biosynthesis lipoprotein
MSVKDTKIIMGMPITVEIVDDLASQNDLEKVFSYFRKVDEQYSPYKESSELSKINRGLPEDLWSDEMKIVLALCEQTKQETNGYFDIRHEGKLDPSGLVKGWAIQNAAEQLLKDGFMNFYIEAGGDIQAHGKGKPGIPWSVGIRNPFNTNEIVKVITIEDSGVATSGTYIRGEHIYNPHGSSQKVITVKSLTVIGPNVYEADRFATAAFAMGSEGVIFIDNLPGFEAYMIDDRQLATFTRGFEKYVAA